MVRRALSRTIRATPPDEATAARYLRLWDKGELYRQPESFPPLTAEALWGRAAPLELEVGCGTGEFLCALAALDPAATFIGVEPWTKVVYRAVQTAAEQGLDNIQFIRAPMQFLYPLLKPDTLRAVYVHFPDPHLRSRRQHKVFNAAFLDAMHRALEPGGRLSVVSDHAALFEEMLRLVERDGRWAMTHDERYLVGYDPPLKSRYQRLWEKHDVEPLRFEARKREAESEEREAGSEERTSDE